MDFSDDFDDPNVAYTISPHILRMKEDDLKDYLNENLNSDEKALLKVIAETVLQMIMFSELLDQAPDKSPKDKKRYETLINILSTEEPIN